MIPIFFKNRKKELELNDLYQPLQDHKAEILGDKLCNAWEKQLRNSKEHKKEPRLYKALFDVFWPEILKLGIILVSIEVLLK